VSIHESMKPASRDEILARYREHADRFAAVAARRQTVPGSPLAPLGEVVRIFPGEPETALVPSGRELEVLLLVADGLANREIADRLFITEETTKSHVRSILAKLPAKSRAHAVAVGFRRGLIA
jgi:DNA-binding CsgD family transcriptional regulator